MWGESSEGMSGRFVCFLAGLVSSGHFYDTTQQHNTSMITLSSSFCSAINEICWLCSVN